MSISLRKKNVETQIRGRTILQKEKRFSTETRTESCAVKYKHTGQGVYGSVRAAKSLYQEIIPNTSLLHFHIKDPGLIREDVARKIFRPLGQAVFQKFREPCGSQPTLKGLRKRTPARTICFSFRVTTTRSLSNAVAAIRPSTAGTGSGIPRYPHRAAMVRSTSMMRSRNSRTVRSSHKSRASADTESRLRIRSTPRLSSPIVRTLRNSSDDLRFLNQFTTRGFARSRLRNSEMTSVSTR